MCIWLFGLILQITLSKKLNINPIYFDYFVYIGACFMPVALYNFSKTFSNTKYKLNKKLLIIPTISLLMLWTNDFHHLFYVKYSTITDQTVFGIYFHMHNFYTLLLYFIGLFNLVKYSIRNSGIFSKQAILIIIGSLIPIVLNVLMNYGFIQGNIYLTPIVFSITILLILLASVKFSFFKITPIALQTIVDRISDSYIIVNENRNYHRF